MCGIAGVVTWGRDASDVRRVERLLTALRHRGPDSRGTVTRGSGTVGAVRLSIVDVAGSDQPISHRERDVHLVFNGEIYNHARLRRDLEDRGVRLSTRGDGEVVLAAYLHDEAHFTERLDGMFAFAIWDARRETLVLGRDRLGIKPLYVHASRDGLVFASELRALAADPHVPLAVDRDAVADYYTVRFSPPSCSPLSGVYKVEPGTTVTFDRRNPLGVVQARRRLAVPAAEQEPGPQGPAGSLREVLGESVATTVPPDSTAAAFLSGGLDSSAVSALAVERTGALDAFSVGYADDVWQDETGHAVEVADHLGARHRITRLAADRVRETFLATIGSLDEPIFTPVCLSTYAVAASAAQHHKVVLAGDGSDELLLGYEHLHDAHRAWSSGRPWRDDYWRALGWWSDDDRHEVLDDDMLKRCAPEVSQERWGFTELTAGLDAAEAVRRFEVTAKLPGYHLPRVDQLAMAHGLEVRVPFLRDDVVDWALARPARSLVGGRPKEALRSAARGLVPEGIVDRPKQKFSAPASTWLAGPLREPALDLLHSGEGVEELGLDAAGLARLAARFHRDPAAGGRTVWGIVVVLAWYRSFHGQAAGARTRASA